MDVFGEDGIQGMGDPFAASTGWDDSLETNATWGAVSENNAPKDANAGYLDTDPINDEDDASGTVTSVETSRLIGKLGSLNPTRSARNMFKKAASRVVKKKALKNNVLSTGGVFELAVPLRSSRLRSARVSTSALDGIEHGAAHATPDRPSSRMKDRVGAVTSFAKAGKMKISPSGSKLVPMEDHNNAGGVHRLDVAVPSGFLGQAIAVRGAESDGNTKAAAPFEPDFNATPKRAASPDASQGGTAPASS